MRPLLTWSIALPVAAAVLGRAGWHATSARAEGLAALERLQRVGEQAREYAALREGNPGETSAAPASELPGRLAAAIAACGLPAQTLASFEASGGHSRATAVLQGLTLPQLGRYLVEWRRLEPAWTAVAIDLAPAGEVKDPRIGGDLPLRVVLSMESAAAPTGGVP